MADQQSAAAVAYRPGRRGMPQLDEEVGPHRRCIVSGMVKPAEEMIRFVVGPDGSVVPDIEGAVAGSGNMVERRTGCGKYGVAKNLFAKAFRRKVTGTARPCRSD